MTQKKVLTYIALSIVLLSSCKKEFLTLYPEGNLNEGNFYLSTADFQQAVNGAYAPLRDVANNAYFMDEMRSDNAFFDYYVKDRGNQNTENIITFLDDPATTVTQNRYTADFNGVSRTNVILDRIAAISFPMTDADKNQITAEAKALRAHYYFDLVRTYGGVPLSIHEVKVSSEAFKARATAEEVYTQIIADFTDALNILAAPTFAIAQTGRVTKGTVATELGTVYMQRKEYAKAIPLFQSVTQMGYALLPSFRDVFNPAFKNANKELIFDVQFQSGTTGQSSNFIYRFTPITPNTQNILGVSYLNNSGNWNVPTDDVISTFEAGDTRLDASIGVIEGALDASSNFIPSRIVSIIGYTAPAGVVARKFARKVFYPPYPAIRQDTDQNWP